MNGFEEMVNEQSLLGNIIRLKFLIWLVAAFFRHSFSHYLIARLYIIELLSIYCKLLSHLVKKKYIFFQGDKTVRLKELLLLKKKEWDTECNIFKSKIRAVEILWNYELKRGNSYWKEETYKSFEENHSWLKDIVN